MENQENKQFRHGESYSRAYNIWAQMRQRCTNPKAANYYLYGGRGVTCCDEWKKFAKFLEDMGHPPGEQYTLDRIDSDGNYTKENCRWADRETQACNRRNCVKITAFGKTLTISQWARETGKTRDEIRHRVFEMGMDPEEALRSGKMSWVQRRVLRVSLDGSEKQVFDSLAEAGKKTGVKRESLWAALKRHPVAKFAGYYWEYAD